MCIICASRAGVHQPDDQTIIRMFNANPHGAGYMVARNGRVEISKGFMSPQEFLHAVHYEHFTADDPVVYHFRIATQAGITPAMTHPFPLTSSLEDCKMLDVACHVGVAHNGIIRLTSNPTDREYSDTAHFIAEFLAYLVRTPDDLRDPGVLDAIERLTGDSKWAIMDGSGYIATAGHFVEDGGLLFSNNSFRPRTFSFGRWGQCFLFEGDEDETEQKRRP